MLLAAMNGEDFWSRVRRKRVFRECPAPWKKWPSDERNYFHYPHPTRCQWNNTKHLSQNLAEKWMDEDENQAYFSAFFLLFFHESHSPSPCLTLSQIGNWGFLHLRSLGIMLFHHHHGWCGSCCFFIILPLSKIFFCKKVNCFFGILKCSMNEEKKPFFRRSSYFH